jgi:hypothetical protein
MIVDRIIRTPFGTKEKRPVTVEIVPEVIDHLEEFFALAGFVNKVMKFSVKLDELFIVFLFESILRLFYFFLELGDLLR